MSQVVKKFVKDTKRYSFFEKVLFSVGITMVVFGLISYFSNPTNIKENSVMIVNKGQTHGGTGIVYRSYKDGSFVLTNDHVCKAIKTGGLVKTRTKTYQIQSFLESDVSDLCMVYVSSNLGQNTKLASDEPTTFNKAKVSGHPALLPTVITEGHFSDRSIITVMTGFKPCTQAEVNDPGKVLLCAFFGGLPVLKSYDSVLVTATIMPGSSGSGVYNSKNELSGVVFAGSGDIGYAWTVPYDQVHQFLTSEQFKPKYQEIDQTVSLFSANEDSGKEIHEVLKKCNQPTSDVVENICAIIKRDNTWVK